MKPVKIIAKNINSKKLYALLNGTVSEAISTLGVRWSSDQHRSSFIEVIEDFLQEQIEESRITQFKVICDVRNNPHGFAETSKTKEYVFEIQYRQPHCLNLTKITYYIPKKQ